MAALMLANAVVSGRGIDRFHTTSQSTPWKKEWLMISSIPLRPKRSNGFYSSLDKCCRRSNLLEQTPDETASMPRKHGRLDYRLSCDSGKNCLSINIQLSWIKSYLHTISVKRNNSHHELVGENAQRPVICSAIMTATVNNLRGL